MIALLALLISVDQAGYPTAAPKLAMTRAVGQFTITRDGESVLAGMIVNGVADFSSINTPGNYELHVGAEHVPVHIADDPYRSVLDLASRAFHGQRCGTAVDLGSGYSHPACHLTAAFHPSSGGSGRAPVGGWHDAGDYGRYVVNSGITMGTLLWACEMFGLDLLDEIRWNLDWMLSMQDADGGVWHKETSKEFADFVMPQDDHSISDVIGKSSCATGDFAAVMAIAARIYRRTDLLDAAKRAFAWLDRHPNQTFRNPRDVKTGEYGDRDCRDERLWAAAEIFRTSGDETARQYFLMHARIAIGPPNWQNVGALAAWTYALSEKADASQIRRQTIAAADEIVKRANAHPYRIPMRSQDYVWGSNAVAANYGVLLLVANRMQPKKEYVDATLDIIHYLLGRNPFSLSWVTGVGSKHVMHPHHRPSASDGIVEPWPGLLAGGPNQRRQDPVLRKMPRGVPPAEMYADDQESYASNEVAINWNAPLVFILAGERASRPQQSRVSRDCDWSSGGTPDDCGRDGRSPFGACK